MSLKNRAAIALLLSTLIAPLHAAPPEIDPAKDLPRFPAVEPKDAFKTLKIKPGFHVELVASEPLIVDPIALAFDENGRLFVVEMRDYSERRDERLGRIKMLEDTNGDGAYDKATIYADGLAWPTAVSCWDGGILVGCTPDIFYFKDTNGDGKADIRRVLFTGFGNTKERLNVQGLMNGFNWGLDNRIHGLAAPNGGIVTNLARTGDKPLDLNNRNFSINPRTFEMLPEAGGGQYGLTFNSRGKKLTCSNSEHLMMFMYEGKYADRNPYYAMPKGLINIAVDGGAAEVFRASPEEPWRVIRTKWRVSGVATGPVEGGGRASGYFTGATGVTVYRGDAFPPEYRDNAFSGDAGGNLMHRKLLIPDDVGYKGQRPADEQKMEFLASTDTWFRPVLFANGPDGCFYIMDMYREVIEHPWSLPEQLKKHIDLNSGNDRGRIYRVVPDGFKHPKLPQLGKLKGKQLVALLEHSNGWHRETAARLIYERQDKSVVGPLRSLAQKSKSPYGRMHSLYALDGLAALTEEDVARGLADESDIVREHALKLSEKFVKQGSISPALWAGLSKLAKDPSMFVTYQLAFTLGEIHSPERNAVLAECLRRDLNSQWMRAAVLSSLAEGAGEMLSLVASDSTISASKDGQEFIAQLVSMIGAKNDPAEVKKVLAFVAQAKDAGTTFTLLRGLGDGLQRAGSSLQSVNSDGGLKPVLKRASEIAAQKDAPTQTRVQAAQFLAFGDYASVSPTLLSLLNADQPHELQSAALNSLGRFTEPQVATELINRWSTFAPRQRDEAASILVARPERVTALLDAMQSGSVRASDLSTAQVKFLRNHRDASIRSKAAKVLGAPATASKRQDVVDAFMPALNLKGDASHGKVLYLERCSSCHRLEGQGFALGPDLITVKTTGKEKILLNLIDPNKEVAPQFQAYEIETKDDESFIGLVINESATSVTMRQAYGKENTIPRTKITKMRSQNNSLMPEGLETGLKPQDIADLLEYVVSARAEK